MTIDQRIDAVIAREGGYADRPSDRGGPTRYGITQAVARAHGYAGAMAALPRATAAAIYRADYWTAPRFDLVAQRSAAIAGELFDTGVNCGVATAVILLQRALNAFQGAALKRDGRILAGGATLATLDAYLAARARQGGEAVLVALLNALQGERYVRLVEADATQRAFVFGWIRNRVMDRSPSA
ncbi:glycoside hydrolase family 108 protein [Sphingomonas morindae]|uniref:Uncharacterized protein n=1 Tax=Sphingomonas morindae TaxID=1541170 RepID=A0ABY4X709_9SPHN|nr:glycosyl hydrolase 108 family protein [Sphingomonas morindae]USI72719.1 hypothetical protein LHA26_15815 [Sphingomonas morindae]